MEKQEQFKTELTSLLNRYSKENGSNTPDFILAEYLICCLENYNTTLQSREKWYGREINNNKIEEIKSEK